MATSSTGSPSPQSTPRRAPHSTSSNERFNTSGVDSARDAIADQYAVVEMPVEWIFDQCVAKVQPERLDETIAALTTAGILDDKGRVTAYAGKPPSKWSENEQTTFLDVKTFLEKILDKDPDRTSCKLHLDNELIAATILSVMATETTPTGDKHNTGRCDHYLIRNNELTWRNIALPFEFKKGKSEQDQRDNWKKIFFALYHILRDDACRNFVLGLSIEDDEARVWFVSRWFVGVSESFNWIEEPRKLIQVVLSMCHYPENESAFITAMWSMGIDPTLRQVRVDGKAQYEFTDDDGTVYVTERVISDYKADDLGGRGTRVWLVRRKVHKPGENNDERWVLKEQWKARALPTEGENWNTLHSLTRGHVETEGTFNQYVMQLEYQTTLIPPDTAPSPSVDPQRQNFHRIIDIRNSTFVRRAGVGLPGSSIPEGPCAIYGFPSLKHRTLWRGGNHIRVLTEVESMAEFLTALEGAIKALKLLCSLGYIHRDVSVGNIYYDDQLKCGRLGDLEFVCKYGQVSRSSEVRTGTPAFWAADVSYGDYIVVPDLEDRFFFFHNHVHDLEATYWLLHYPVLACKPVLRSSMPDLTSTQRSSAYNAYLRSSQTARRHILVNGKISPSHNLPKQGPWTINFLRHIWKNVGQALNQIYQVRLGPIYKNALLAHEDSPPDSQPHTNNPAVKFAGGFADLSVPVEKPGPQRVSFQLPPEAFHGVHDFVLQQLQIITSSSFVGQVESLRPLPIHRNQVMTRYTGPLDPKLLKSKSVSRRVQTKTSRSMTTMIQSLALGPVAEADAAAGAE